MAKEEKTSQDPFQHQILMAVENFAKSTSKTLESMMAVKTTLGPIQFTVGESVTEHKLFICLLFTGTVYGEFILSLDEEVAANILGLTIQGKTGEALNQLRTEISESFCELLNIAVGESILELSAVYKKLTMTAPRVYFGNAAYPRLKTGRAQLICDKGTLDCFLYVDRMKLDIAASYKDALGSLQKAHSELQGAMTKLQEQQTLLVQSEKMAALGTMAAGVAHEINSPLATVSLIGDQLREVFGESEETWDRASLLGRLDLIDSTISRIAKITNGMRVYAQGIQRGGMKEAPLSAILQDVLTFCEKDLKERNIRLTQINPVPLDLTLECRAPEISQALLSLIHNSSDAIQGLQDKWIKLEAIDLGETVEIKVTDSGSGILENIRDKIFDPFFTTKAIGKGAGLGLSISRGIIKDHHGTIGVDPTSSNTCFIIRLPKHHLKAVGAQQVN